MCPNFDHWIPEIAFNSILFNFQENDRPVSTEASYI